ncbi:hypothetical protein [Engelhardtia mirabilis]|uniref:Uncharacterized protein n=1 Tax=Engelhardtia mirabilis TaxID=2528011 RepID=A0A518BP42_9BACT|nr:hypothetical protein Pla133_38500 [Planctomycetes bacterium Pla133]QDV03074.1 hypothetical protein Pla86_38490 [Planctomycetes bacterium Pla86]
MPNYRFTTKFVAVNDAAVYSNATSAAMIAEHKRIVDEDIAIFRGEMTPRTKIDIYDWSVEEALSVGAPGIRAAVVAAAQRRAGEIRILPQLEESDPGLVLATNAGVEISDDLYCIPPRPADCYHRFVLSRQGETGSIPVVDEGGAEIGYLALLLTYRDVE